MVKKRILKKPVIVDGMKVKVVYDTKNKSGKIGTFTSKVNAIKWSKI